VKRGMAISGGGEKGPYAVGVMKALYMSFGFQYDVMAGVSIGAVIAAHQAIYPKGEERVAWNDLENLFMGLRTRDIYRSWRPFGLLHAPWKRSLYNSAGARDLIHKHLDVQRVRSSGKQLRIGATSLSSGEYRVFTENDVPLHELVYASAAFPVAFSPAKIRGQWWTDGGVRTVTPIRACIDAACTHVDVIMLSPPGSNPAFDKDPDALDVALRAIELQGDQIVADDLDKALLWNRLLEAGVDGRGKRPITFNVIRPKLPLPTKPLHFGPQQAHDLIELGFRDAVLALRR
jgi:NTE family protein